MTTVTAESDPRRLRSTWILTFRRLCVKQLGPGRGRAVSFAVARERRDKPGGSHLGYLALHSGPQYGMMDMLSFRKHRELPVRLNEIAFEHGRRMMAEADQLRVAVHEDPGGSRIIDCGVNVPGGLEAGRRLAEICMAGLGEVSFASSSAESWHMPGLMVRTDHPVAACMASQYAGWQLAVEGFFALGSGPMRAIAGKESLFDSIGYWGAEEVAIGVLETSQLPSPEVCQHIARQCRVDPSKLILLVTPTASQAGTIQVVARSVEMAMHKLFELGFELDRVESGVGLAPVPPVAGSDLEAMGRTHDAILYGSEVTLWLRGDESSMASVGARVPSDTSPEHGHPFVRIFERHNRDFSRIDPSLFGPAVLTLFNLDTGRSYRFGRMMSDVLQRSFTT